MYTIYYLEYTPYETIQYEKQYKLQSSAVNAAKKLAQDGYHVLAIIGD